ncbi:MAG TPA: hypothetical protein VNW72_00515 [Chthoniobacterales bacterium]|nr:hypothetical protein [Chthoniobacterales bacterium]
MDADDVLVGEFETSICLLLQIVEHGMIVNDQLREKFESNVAAQFIVASEPNDAHATAAKDPR